jgi:rRNA maturation RNase YbeY
MSPGAGTAPLDLAFSLVLEVDVPPGVISDDLEDLAAFVLSAEGAAGSWELTVALVSDERLQELHRDFMGIDEPTDIMTFPSEEQDEASRGGELVISVDHARTQAAAWGMTPVEEIRFLVVHGLLHLLGWRDDDEEQRRRMLARQEALFERWRAEKG